VSIDIYYAVSEDGPPVEGDRIGTARGWLDWSDYVLARHDEYPEGAHLAAHGWLPADAVPDLETELERLRHADGVTPDLAGVTAALASAARELPDGAAALMVSAGEPGDDALATSEAVAPQAAAKMRLKRITDGSWEVEETAPPAPEAPAAPVRRVKKRATRMPDGTWEIEEVTTSG
jgi:hypothetical protein